MTSASPAQSTATTFYTEAQQKYMNSEAGQARLKGYRLIDVTTSTKIALFQQRCEDGSLHVLAISAGGSVSEMRVE